MLKTHPGKITPGMALRVFADVLMIQFSLLAGLSLSLVSHLLMGNLAKTKTLPEYFWDMLGQYADAGWSLAIICLVVFYLSGFYTYGRFYQGRYKALIVFQAVCQSYLIFGFLTYFLHGKGLPRAALALSWGISLVLLIGARLWLHVWKKIADPEQELLLARRRGDG